MAHTATQNGPTGIMAWLRLGIALLAIILGLATGYAALKADIRENAAGIRHEGEFRQSIAARLDRIEEKIDDLRDRMPAKSP